ncbi:MAG: type IV pilus assembly protein PilM [Candidatus Hydrogenedentota bacterium]
MLFSKPKNAVGIDIGTHSVKAVQISRAGGGLRIDNVGHARLDRTQMNMDPIAAQAQALQEAVRFIPLQHSLLVGALPGQSVVIRYPRLPNMGREEFAQAVDKEASQNIPYDLSEVNLDWTPVTTVTEGERTLTKILLVAAKHETIESRVEVAQAAGLHFAILDVDSLALADAAEALGLTSEADESVALVNLGASATSIHFLKEGVSNFIRDVNWGSRELIQAITRSRRCDHEEAERLLFEAAKPAPAPVGGDEEAAMSVEEEPAEPTEAARSWAGSSVLDPLDDELADLGDLDAPQHAEPAAAASTSPGADKSVDELLTTPLNRLVSEIRRSFDYYEQQLYEQPVSRIILSGGTAQLPVLRQTLVEELGVEQVDVANPMSGGLKLGDSLSLNILQEHPAQFMVAVGLAVRGAADL